MEVRVVPFHGFKETADLYLSIKLFANFPLQSLMRRLPGLNLPARELPPSLKFPITSLGGEHFAVTYYYCRYDFYRFHHTIELGRAHEMI